METDAPSNAGLGIEEREGESRLVVKEDLVASSVTRLRAEMLEAVEQAGGSVVLDLSAASQVDSLGISLVVGLFKTCQKRGLAFQVEGVNANILRIFELFKLTRHFPVKGE